MPKKLSPSTINQTAIGDGNVQVAGDNNTVNVNQTFIQKVSNFFTGDIEQQRALRNRRAMLELVKNTWVKGVLEKSLYNEVLIELNMEENPSAVEHPWDMQLQLPNNENRILPSGTSIMEVFDEMNGTMLILGGPGSGKIRTAKIRIWFPTPETSFPWAANNNHIATVWNSYRPV